MFIKKKPLNYGQPCHLIIFFCFDHLDFSNNRLLMVQQNIPEHSLGKLSWKLLSSTPKSIKTWQSTKRSLKEWNRRKIIFAVLAAILIILDIFEFFIWKIIIFVDLQNGTERSIGLNYIIITRLKITLLVTEYSILCSFSF